MKTTALRILVAAAATAVAACGRIPDRGDLVFINGAEPEPLDPPLMTAQATSRLGYAVFEGLTAYDETGTARPGVAEHWDISADGKHYTFHLRHDAKWSNGEPLTAEDFIYSWRRTALPETASEYVYQLYYIRGAKDFSDGKTKDWSQVGVRAPDPFTLEVELENPTPFFIDLCAFSTLLPVHRPTVEKFADWATNPAHHVGNGAYLLKEWRLFDRVRLVRNPHYWNANKVAMKTIDILPSGRPMTAFNLYATGVADLMMDKGLAPTSLMDQLRKRPDFHAGSFLGNYFFRFNCKPDRKVGGRPNPFADPRVRQAFSLVIDKKYLTERITRAGETPAFSFTPPGAGGSYEPPPSYARDPERARALLVEAGFPGGKGFPIFYYLYRADSDLDQDIAVELQGTFSRELGVQMQLTRQEWTVYLNSQSALEYDLCRSSWVGDYNDPNTFLDMFVTDGGNNRTGWSNARYDALIASAGRETDTRKRFEIFHEAEKLLVSEDMPICPLYYYVGIQFYDPARLGGVVSNLIDEHPLRAMYWKTR